jgi:hypothetical protein
MRSRLQALSGWFLAALIWAPAWGAIPPQPGTINSIEGRATMGGQALSEKSVGTAELGRGWSVSTQDGRAEILPAPGIFLRIDHETTVEIANPGLADTLLADPKGRAMVESRGNPVREQCRHQCRQRERAVAQTGLVRS